MNIPIWLYILQAVLCLVGMVAFYYWGRRNGAYYAPVNRRELARRYNEGWNRGWTFANKQSAIRQEYPR